MLAFSGLNGRDAVFQHDGMNFEKAKSAVIKSRVRHDRKRDSIIPFTLAPELFGTVTKARSKEKN